MLCIVGALLAFSPGMHLGVSRSAVADRGPTPRAVDASDEAQPTKFSLPPNPFLSKDPFSLYEEDDLSKLWEIHQTYFGAEEDVDTEADDTVDADAPLMGGLHDAVLRTLAEIDEESPPIQ
jgi:hypothetical protein